MRARRICVILYFSLAENVYSYPLSRDTGISCFPRLARIALKNKLPCQSFVRSTPVPGENYRRRQAHYTGTHTAALGAGEPHGPRLPPDSYGAGGPGAAVLPRSALQKPQEPRKFCGGSSQTSHHPSSHLPLLTIKLNVFSVIRHGYLSEWGQASVHKNQRKLLEYLWLSSLILYPSLISMSPPFLSWKEESVPSPFTLWQWNLRLLLHSCI